VDSIVSYFGKKAKAWIGRALSGPFRRAAEYFAIEVGQANDSAGPSHYERVYEHVAQVLPADESVGDGDFDLIGRIELGVLIMEGMQPHHTLFDFGCGTGRLAIHAVPYLAKGRYIGSDISESMLVNARKRVASRVAGAHGHVSFIKQSQDVFDLPDGSIDYMCAFSVFTHMEAEDTYRYLKAARRLLKPGGRVIFSCLPMRLTASRRIFLAQAEMSFDERWKGVRNFTTSIDHIEVIANLAGWEVARWYAGDEPSIRVALADQMLSLGQSVCTLLPSSSNTEHRQADG
jgi:ubiquinone/menaquinone biosynthesis C-methylase UbiE